jgi:DNA-binding transcriptional MerR regulator
MFKIGDFSKLCRVSVIALRYYDELGLLKPAQVDRFTGYRYYSLDQLPRLNRILALKDLGFSLEETARLLDDALAPAQMRALLQTKQAQIQQRVAEEQARLARVEARLRQIEQEETMPTYEVTLKRLDPLTVAAVRQTIGSIDEIGGLFDDVYAYLTTFGVEPAGPALAIWHSAECDLDAEAAVPIADAPPENGCVIVYELPAIKAAVSVTHHGSYSAISQAYYALQAWAATNEYRVAAPERTVYLRGGKDPHDESYITEILFPVEPETRLDVLKPALEPGDLIKFSERARQAIDLAVLEAAARRHGAIGVEHLLIGLFGVADGFAAHALRELGVTQEQAQQVIGQDRVSQAHGQWPAALNEPARRAFVDAVDEARLLQHDYIGTEHILLGLTRKQVNVLERAGTTTNEVRVQVMRMLAQP